MRYHPQWLNLGAAGSDRRQAGDLAHQFVDVLELSQRWPE
jgi:hypothetical protein